MSHFTVMVVTDTDSEDELARVLQPYHEYECTGTEDEYVVFVSEHEEVVEEWNKKEEKWKLPNSPSTYDSGDNIFHREPTAQEVLLMGPMAVGSGVAKGVLYRSRDWGDGKGYRAKVQMSDEEKADLGYIKVEVPRSDLYLNIEEFADAYFGYDKVRDGKIGRMTNPNAEWDWWVVGGRWKGLLLGVDGKEHDQLRKDQVDWEGMRTTGENQAAERWSKIEMAAQGETWRTWENVREENKGDINKAREIYHGQEVLKRVKEAFPGTFMDSFDYFMTKSKDQAIAEGGESRIATFAFLNNKKWLERGEMGWWGIVTDENDDWGKGFMALVNEVRDDQYLTIVDCHI